MKTLTCVGALIALACAGAEAQMIEASAQTFTVQSHVRFGSTLAAQSGQWIGGEAAFTLHRVRLGLTAALGSLNGDMDTVHPDSKARMTAISVHGMLTSWLALGAVAEAKVFTTDAGTTAWRLLGANIRATPKIDKALDGLVDVTFWPAASVIGGESIPLAMRAVVGATYYVADGPVGIRVAYRLERFDFSAGGRLEQFRGATLGAVLRLGR